MMEEQEKKFEFEIESALKIKVYASNLEEAQWKASTLLNDGSYDEKLRVNSIIIHKSKK